MSEERDKDLHEEKDTRMDEIRDTHWRTVSEKGDNKKKIHDLR